MTLPPLSVSIDVDKTKEPQHYDCLVHIRYRHCSRHKVDGVYMSDGDARMILERGLREAVARMLEEKAKEIRGK